MQLSEWVAKQMAQEKKPKTHILRKLSEGCGVSLITLQNVEKGLKLRQYEKAKAIVDATGGLVKLKDVLHVPDGLSIAKRKKD